MLSASSVAFSTSSELHLKCHFCCCKSTLIASFHSHSRSFHSTHNKNQHHNTSKRHLTSFRLLLNCQDWKWHAKESLWYTEGTRERVCEAVVTCCKPKKKTFPIQLFLSFSLQLFAIHFFTLFLSEHLSERRNKLHDMLKLTFCVFFSSLSTESEWKAKNTCSSDRIFILTIFILGQIVRIKRIDREKMWILFDVFECFINAGILFHHFMKRHIEIIDDERERDGLIDLLIEWASIHFLNRGHQTQFYAKKKVRTLAIRRIW